MHAHQECSLKFPMKQNWKRLGKVGIHAMWNAFKLVFMPILQFPWKGVSSTKKNRNRHTLTLSWDWVPPEQKRKCFWVCGHGSCVFRPVLTPICCCNRKLLTLKCPCSVRVEQQLCICHMPNKPNYLLKCRENTRRNTANACQKKWKGSLRISIHCQEAALRVTLVIHASRRQAWNLQPCPPPMHHWAPPDRPSGIQLKAPWKLQSWTLNTCLCSLGELYWGWLNHGARASHPQCRKNSLSALLLVFCKFFQGSKTVTLTCPGVWEILLEKPQFLEHFAEVFVRLSKIILL